jgi:hypothetical protein
MLRESLSRILLFVSASAVSALKSRVVSGSTLNHVVIGATGRVTARLPRRNPVRRKDVAKSLIISVSFAQKEHCLLVIAYSPSRSLIARC